MPAEPPGQLRGAGWRLPITIAGLLIVVMATFIWVAYHEVHAAAYRAAEARAADVAGQLAELLSVDVADLRSQAATVASDPILLEALSRPTAMAYARARAVLNYQLEELDEVRAVELWNRRQNLVAQARSDPSPPSEAAAPAFPTWAEADSIAISGFRAAGEEIGYAVAARIGGSGRPLGWIVHHLTLTDSPEGARQVEGLIGPGASFHVGVPGGTWTDLVDLVEPPPTASVPATAGAPRVSEEEPRMLGAGAAVRGAPWFAWVEFPLSVVLSQPREFLSRIIPMGILVVALGALGGGLLSHRLTSALRTSEERFRALASTAPDAIVTADGDGDITYFNPGAERIFGHSASKVLGRPLTDLMPARFRDAHRRGIERWASADEDRVLNRTMELTGLRADGTEFPLELALAGQGHGGGPVFTGIIRDVTERQRRDRELRRYARELEAANEELEAFSYSVSHDLRAPLRAIHGFSQAILEDYRDRLDEEGVDYLDRVCAATERMGILIDDLLELSRATRAEMRFERVDLSQLAEQTAETLSADAPDRRVDFRIAPGLEARGDRKLLSLVLGNLMANAWKFTAQNDGAVIEVGLSNGKETSSFFVRDDGAGFDMTYADKLFDPFQRLHSPNEFEGTGIGLAIVQRIVHRHGGTVWGEGEVGRGATFHFTLPEP